MCTLRFLRSGDAQSAFARDAFKALDPFLPLRRYRSNSNRIPGFGSSKRPCLSAATASSRHTTKACIRMMLSLSRPEVLSREEERFRRG
jgi:hypothetical protein